MSDKVQMYASLFSEVQGLLYGDSLSLCKEAARKPLRVVSRIFHKPKIVNKLSPLERQMRGVHAAEQHGLDIAASKAKSTFTKGVLAGGGIGAIGTGVALTASQSKEQAKARSKGRMEGAALGATAAIAAPYISRLASNQGFSPDAGGYQQGEYV
jgi:hypothetical protein